MRHRRHGETPHAFTYALDQVFLDLDELDQVFAERWLWSVERTNLCSFRRADYLGDPDVPLATAVRDAVASQTGRRPLGPIRLLTHVRTLGLSFNPVSFYYCYASDGDTLEAIVAEITNTPWRQRHRYVLSPRDGAEEGDARFRFRFPKAFHISPFQPMDRTYTWRFSTPGKRLSVHMESHTAGRKTFDATLLLARRELSGAALEASLLRHPWTPAEVLWGIYSQALRLWWKGAATHRHPDRAQTPWKGSVR